jgi:hypothetical protein
MTYVPVWINHYLNYLFDGLASLRNVEHESNRGRFFTKRLRKIPWAPKSWISFGMVMNPK